ncbi:cytochrome c oxidase subunit 7A2-like, mitochondrial [Littorina saxatilis]|uniref:Cytochrome c oxidase subunit VIIa n=1 Tax=Littorina saxatilis TaxID=31220 RepID=A0AAN9BEW8_9CAEN
MYYKFNSMINRIMPSTQSQAYAPQGLRSVAKEPSRIIFESSKIQPVHEPEVTMTRASSTGAAKGPSATALNEALGVVPNNARYQKIMQMQNFFLKEDGRLVWQKFGHDRALFYTTVALCFVGSALLGAQLLKMAFPRTNQD